MALISVPPITNPRWRDVVTGKIARPWKLLAVRIMMTRIAGLTKGDPSSDMVSRCVQDLHSFFEKNARIAQDDLASIFE